MTTTPQNLENAHDLTNEEITKLIQERGIGTEASVVEHPNTEYVDDTKPAEATMDRPEGMPEIKKFDLNDAGAAWAFIARVGKPLEVIAAHTEDEGGSEMELLTELAPHADVMINTVLGAAADRDAMQEWLDNSALENVITGFTYVIQSQGKGLIF